MRLRRASRLTFLLAFAAVAPLGIALGQTVPGLPIVSDLPVAGGTERVLFLGAQGARALVVLLPGSDGIIGLDSGGGVHQLGGNFLVRTIGQWVAQGFDVVLPDAPNGTSLLGQRHLPAYADAISRAIDFGRSRANLPVWLIGTSQGATAAVNGAAHLGSKVSGAVLASSVTRPGRAGETLFDAEPGAIAVPVLVVSNQSDLCGQPAGRCTECARSPDALAAHGAGDGDEQPDRQTLRPLRGDVAARLSWNRGYGGAPHLRLDQSGWRALNPGQTKSGTIGLDSLL
jgi:pimeloyl-ACP methyl ester carboxylesterase